MTIETILPIPDIFSAKRILCIQPHYDDNDIAAAGILTQLAKNGAEIFYLTATDDLMGVVDTSLSDADAARFSVANADATWFANAKWAATCRSK